LRDGRPPKTLAMIDIHSHILWGLDDGARTLEQSLAMLKVAREFGTTDIVATPHANLRYQFRDNTIDQRIQELSAASGGSPHIHRGCDFHLSFDNVQAALQNPARFSINGGQYILVEFPDTPLTGMGQVLGALLDRKLIPIMTHPERHVHLRRLPPEFEEWIGMGCLAQITAHSLLGRFGKQSEESAWDMIRNGLAHFVASDAHDDSDRTPRLDTAFQAVSFRMNAAHAQLLFVDNPKAMLWGKEVRSERPKRRFWYRLAMAR
jgi:protein-tyrosine phosphatase